VIESSHPGAVSDRPPFMWCARGRTHLEVKVQYTLGKGVLARRNPEEAGGKALACDEQEARIETARRSKRAIRRKAQFLHGAP
jgi:hypothetical protein